MSGVSIRRAGPDDVDFLVELLADGDVRPFLGPRTGLDRESLSEEVARSEREPEQYGRFVIEVDGERAGALGFHVANEPSRIARLERLAVDPGFRGRGVADEAARLFQRLLLVELGFHRLELEVYAFNERALAHTERVGFVREGVKRRAYLREGEWLDAVMYALLREDPGPLVALQAMSSGFWNAITLRAAASSVAPIGTAMGAPCVLASLGARAPEARQHHLEGH